MNDASFLKQKPLNPLLNTRLEKEKWRHIKRHERE